MKVRQMIEKIVDEGSSEKMYKLSEMLDDLICDLKTHDPKMYKDYKTCLYELAYGKVILEEKAIEIVNDMEPYGEHYDIDRVKEMIRDSSKYNVTDFYIVINSLYNDYCDIFGDDDEIYHKMAKKWLDDEDAVEDKVYYYFMNIPKRD